MTTKIETDPRKIAADQDKEMEKAEELTNIKIVPTSVLDKTKDGDKNVDEILKEESENKPVVKTQIGSADDSNDDVTATVNMIADNVVVLDK